jgi:nucleoside 2-deoxyribosyltransferase
MIVVGGIYRERCDSVGWDQIFGSAGRAACLLSGVFGKKVKLFGWYGKRQLTSLYASMAPYSIDMRIRAAPNSCEFRYLHPLSTPVIQNGRSGQWNEEDTLKGKSVLAFGSFEGMPTIICQSLVIDPQNENIASILRRNTITADKIAVVGNEEELSLNEADDLAGNIKAIFELNRQIRTIVVKRGIFGTLVFERTRTHPKRITPYRSNRVFKIGSGDAYSAAFAYFWTQLHETSELAADHASRVAACYVNDPHLNFSTSEILKAEPIRTRSEKGQIYLAAPFFTLSDKLLLADCHRALLTLGATVFSPLHDVGVLDDDHMIVKLDLAGLRKSRAVLALLHNHDPGSVFEIGYARSKGIPVVAFCEQSLAKDTTMLSGSDCQIETDYCTAIYKAAWAAIG